MVGKAWMNSGERDCGKVSSQYGEVESMKARTKTKFISKTYLWWLSSAKQPLPHISFSLHSALKELWTWHQLENNCLNCKPVGTFQIGETLTHCAIRSVDSHIPIRLFELSQKGHLADTFLLLIFSSLPFLCVCISQGSIESQDLWNVSQYWGNLLWWLAVCCPTLPTLVNCE